MKDLKVLIFGIAAALLASMALIAALDSYVTRIHTQAPREVFRMEAVTVTAQQPQAPTRSAEAEDVAPAAKPL